MHTRAHTHSSTSPTFFSSRTYRTCVHVCARRECSAHMCVSPVGRSRYVRRRAYVISSALKWTCDENYPFPGERASPSSLSFSFGSRHSRSSEICRSSSRFAPNSSNASIRRRIESILESIPRIAVARPRRRRHPCGSLSHCFPLPSITVGHFALCGAHNVRSRGRCAADSTPPWPPGVWTPMIASYVSDESLSEMLPRSFR